VISSRAARGLLVAVILLAALAIRVAYIETTPYHAVTDAGTYNRMASMISQHGDYHTGSGPKTGAGNTHGPTAYFPPAFPYALSISDLLTGHDDGGKTAVPNERIENAVFSTLAVGVLGLVALEAFGGAVALVAMILAAIYPVFIEESGTLVAENLLVLLELAAIWTMLRARRSPRPLGWIAGTGVLTGLAVLTHQNAILFLIPFAFATVFAVRRAGGARLPPGPLRTSGRRSATTQAVSRRRQAAGVGLLVLCTIAVIVPWTIRNAVELHAFVPVSDENGITLVGTYNPTSAAAEPVPWKWRLFSHVTEDGYLIKGDLNWTELHLDNVLQTKAINYIEDHPLSPFEVTFHNMIRMFELEGDYAWQNAAHVQGLSGSTAWRGIVSFWILCALAIAGLFTRVVRRAPRWLWAIPVLMALSVALINVETPRFREPVDPFFIMLAACALATAVQRLHARRTARGRPSRRSGLRGTPVGGGRRPQRLAGDRQLVEMVERLA
jgi:hypothetical protein